MADFDGLEHIFQSQDENIAIAFSGDTLLLPGFREALEQFITGLSEYSGQERHARTRYRSRTQPERFKDAPEMDLDGFLGELAKSNRYMAKLFIDPTTEGNVIFEQDLSDKTRASAPFLMPGKSKIINPYFKFKFYIETYDLDTNVMFKFECDFPAEGPIPLIGHRFDSVAAERYGAIDGLYQEAFGHSMNYKLPGLQTE